mgnify:CR=1 FL=1
MGTAKTGKVLFWLVWLLGIVVVVGVLVLATARREVADVVGAALQPVDDFARVHFGETYSRGAGIVAGVIGEGISGALGGIGESFGLTARP